MTMTELHQELFTLQHTVDVRRWLARQPRRPGTDEASSQMATAVVALCVAAHEIQALRARVMELELTAESRAEMIDELRAELAEYDREAARAEGAQLDDTPALCRRQAS